MKWHPDVPDLPINKPKQIEFIESLDPHVRDSLPGTEVNELIEKAASSIAQKYQDEIGGTFEECIDVVSVALSVTGSSVGGKLGTAMVSENLKAAKIACRIVFEDDELGE